MIQIFGKEKIQTIKNKLANFKTKIANKAQTKINTFDLGLLSIAVETPVNRYQVSYFLRNPDEAPLRSLLSIVKQIENLTNRKFKGLNTKFIIHPTHIHPANSNSFYLSPTEMAEVFSVSIDECVSAEYATDEQLDNCINLKLD